MKINIIIKILRKFLIPAAVSVLLLGLSACNTPDSKVEGSYNNPYSKAEIQKMLRYHGALVAKFDKGQWYFLSGRRWIKIENGGARQFALNHRTPAHSSL